MSQAELAAGDEGGPPRLGMALHAAGGRGAGTAATGASCRLLVDPAGDGVTNMAVDEALLASAVERSSATLRLYRWAEPTLSLGYFQSAAEIADQAPEVRRLPVVRRPTGGGAIIHADELTYCLAVPPAPAYEAGRGLPAAELCAWMHSAIAEAIRALGVRSVRVGLRAGDGMRAATGLAEQPFLCFQRLGRFDLMAAGGKLAGSAQRRRRGAVLQHGSVILRRSFPAQGGASLEELLGRPVAFEQLAAALTRIIAGRGLRLQAGQLTEQEHAAVARLRRKHASREWLCRR